MTMAEKKMISARKEVEKLEASLTRAIDRLEKKNALCVKLGCDWTLEEWRERNNIIRERHKGEAIIPFGNDDDVMTGKQNAAHFDRSLAQSNLEDVERRLESARKYLDKAILEYEGVAAEEEEQEKLSATEQAFLESLTKKQEDYEAWLKWFKEMCLRDGIVIEDVRYGDIFGHSKSGNYFCLSHNYGGYTTRSLHCYTLRIDGRIIFTSGLFSTAYSILKK